MSDPILDAARSWLARAETRARHHDFSRALEYAASGIDEIGDRYRGSGVLDDTEPRKWKAERRAADGHVADGAHALVEVLAKRIRLYALKSPTP